MNTRRGEVIAAMHTRIAAPPAGHQAGHGAGHAAGHRAGYGERAAWLGDEAGRQLNEVLGAAPDAPWTHIVCTTCLSPMFTGWEGHAEAFADRLQRHAALRPIALLQPYQCSGWGYALRFAGTHTNHSHVAISIVDADLHDAVSASYEQAIGRIGFGVTTLGVVLPENAALPQCGGPHPNRAFSEFLHAIKALHRAHGRTPTFIPFLPEGFAGIAERMIGTDTVGPNRHAVYGHSFGADPWIGLIEWFQASRPVSTQTVTLGAFAYHGYYTVGSFDVAPSLRVSLRQAAFPMLEAQQ